MIDSTGELENNGIGPSETSYQIPQEYLTLASREPDAGGKFVFPQQPLGKEPFLIDPKITVPVEDTFIIQVADSVDENGKPGRVDIYVVTPFEEGDQTRVALISLNSLTKSSMRPSMPADLNKLSNFSPRDSVGVILVGGEAKDLSQFSESHNIGNARDLRLSIGTKVITPKEDPLLKTDKEIPVMYIHNPNAHPIALSRTDFVADAAEEQKQILYGFSVDNKNISAAALEVSNGLWLDKWRKSPDISKLSTPPPAASVPIMGTRFAYIPPFPPNP